MTWERWKGLPIWGRALMVLLAAVVLYEFVLLLASPLGNGVGGGRSSFSTRADGLGAWADLLTSAGHDVERAREGVAELELPAGGTVIVPGRRLGADEHDALDQFVRQGGRLVVAGSQAGGTANALLDGGVEYEPGFVDLASAIVPVPETSAVQQVGPTAAGFFADTGPALPVVSGDGVALMAVADLGLGRVVLIADLTPLENQWIGEFDNAALAVAVAGEPERPVVFAEAGSAAGEGGGLSAIPSRWKWALVAGGIAALLGMWSAGRRFGPPQDETRDLPPPRRAYVDALAATLAKSRRPGAAVAPLREAARDRLVRRAALGPDATDEHVRAAAVELGLASDEIEALFGNVDNDDKAMAVGRAMARLGGTKW